MKEFFTLLGVILFIPLLVIYNSFAWGYVATVISYWYVIPLFPSFPILSWLQYAGIMFFVNCFVHTGDNSDIKDEYKNNSFNLIKILFNPWLLLLGAWILKLFY
jgi:hypothetical protein